MANAQTQYRITRMVGEGAFGTVYEGERIGEGISRRVAMKLLHAAHAGRVPLENRLRDEARMLSLINHRAIVRVDDLIKVDNAWCVVMEFVAGADLRALLDSGPVPPRAALQIAEEVAGALHAAHSQLGPEGKPLRLVHRDIKPENIRLTAQGEVKLLDFGIARAEFNAREAATQQGGMGTIVYMSAERFRGEDTHAGDVYALGVTLFELLTAVPPGNSAADADRHPPGKTLQAQWAWLVAVDPALQACIVAMMAPEPEDRPTARECARTLADIRGRLAGERLEDWAERTMPEVVAQNATPRLRSKGENTKSNATMLLVGQTVGVDGSTSATPTRTTTKSTELAVMGVSALLAGTLAVLVAGLVAWWGYEQFGDVPPQVQAPVTPATSPVGAKKVPTDPTPPSGGSSTSGPAGTAPKTEVTTPSPVAVVPVTSKSGATSVPVATPAPVAATPAPVATPQPGAKTSGPVATQVATPVAVPAPATPEVPPKAPVEPTTGTLRFRGTESVTLDGPDANSGPGARTPGIYSANVTFSDGTKIVVNNIRVVAGRTTRVRCDASFATCSVGEPE